MPDPIAYVSSTLDILSKLQNAREKIKDAEVQSILADLSLEVSSLKLKLSELQNENLSLKQEINSLKAVSGDQCPSCRKLSFVLVSTRPHPTFGDLGVQERLYRCATCGFEEPKTVTA